LFVAEQHIPPCFQIVLLLDSTSRNRLPDCHAVLGLNKGDVINDEDAWLLNPAEIIDNDLRAGHPITSSIKGPGAAERTIPWTSAREFDGCAGIKDADEIFVTMTNEVSCGRVCVKVFDHERRWTSPIKGYGAGYPAKGPAILLDRRQEWSDRPFAFTFDD